MSFSWGDPLCTTRQTKALQFVLSGCKPGALIVDICDKGDSYIREKTGLIYKNKKNKVEKGVAFPTCLSLNHTVRHFSPLASDKTVLNEGDFLKIDMGCHIDGFIAVVAHTHVLQQGKVTGKAADVLAAANTAAQVALRLVRPGNLNKDVTVAIQKVAAAYDCKVVEGVLCHQLNKFVIDGNKVVLSADNADTRVDDVEFKVNEVYAIDIVVSTGDGKPKILDEKQTTVYKRAVDQNYHLECKASRSIFGEICRKFPIMPFTARALEKKQARSRLEDCVKHELLQPYHVLHEKPGTLVAHVKFTVLLMPNGSDRVTSHAVQELEPTKTIDDPEINAWLAMRVKTKKRKRVFNLTQHLLSSLSDNDEERVKTKKRKRVFNLTQHLLSSLSDNDEERGDAQTELWQLERGHFARLCLSLAFEMSSDEKPDESRREAGRLMQNIYLHVYTYVYSLLNMKVTT